MRHIAKILAFIVLTTFGWSCRDEDKDPWNEFEVPNGAMVSWTEIKSNLINFSDINNSAYEADIRDNNGRVANYEVFAVFMTDTVAYEAISTFPNTLRISAPRLLERLNAENETRFSGTVNQRPYQIGDFTAGSRIDVFARITDVAGVVYNVKDIGTDLLINPGMRSMMQFSFFISCPFVPEEAAGTYTVVRDDWGIYTSNGSEVLTVTATAGSLTIEGLYSDAFVGITNHVDYPVTVTVNAQTGQATVTSQPSYSTTWIGLNFGVANVVGGGFAFSCSGTITLALDHTVSLGTFSGGPYTITLQKQ